GTHRVPSPQPELTTLARHRVVNHRRTVLVVARGADAQLVAAATAATPVDGDVIDSHIANFCSAHITCTRAITRPAHWWSRGVAQAAPAPRNRIGFSAIGAAEYYLTHHWIPGRDPRATHWLLRSWTPHDGMHPVAHDVDIDTALQHVTI